MITLIIVRIAIIVVIIIIVHNTISNDSNNVKSNWNKRVIMATSPTEGGLLDA